MKQCYSDGNFFRSNIDKIILNASHDVKEQLKIIDKEATKNNLTVYQYIAKLIIDQNKKEEHCF
jgi:hypothetical protein